jgi:hypothetical protein
MSVSGSPDSDAFGIKVQAAAHFSDRGGICMFRGILNKVNIEIQMMVSRTSFRIFGDTWTCFCGPKSISDTHETVACHSVSGPEEFSMICGI